MCCLTSGIKPQIRIRGGVASILGTLAALLIPKCPFCLAAWAGAIVLGAAVRSVLIHSWFLPAFVAVLFLPALALAIRKRRFSAERLCWTAGTLALVEAVFFYRW
jgi:hypothetical protein